MGSITIITGIMAAGKSTVAQALAERLPRSVHVRGDVFRRMIVSGRDEITLSPSAAAVAQLQLRYELGAMVAARYCDAGFEVVLQDIILGEDLRNVARLLGERTVRTVVLCPSPDVVAGREARRHKSGYVDGWTPEAFDREFRESTRGIGFWLDTSDLTVDETVDRILAHIGENDLPERSRSGRETVA